MGAAPKWFRVSSRIFPSRIRMTRSQIAATSGSWVTSTNVWPSRPVELAQERQDLVGPLGVQVAGRLVGQDQRRLVDERPGDRDALLLAARQLGRTVVGPLGEADELERLDGHRSAGRARRSPA